MHSLLRIPLTRIYLHRATRGIGRTQPVEWQDAGEALEHDELKGCLMPKGAAKDVNPPGAHLQYNEVSLHQGQSVSFLITIPLAVHCLRYITNKGEVSVDGQNALKGQKQRIPRSFNCNVWTLVAGPL